jgi:hypothetical protein
VGGDYDPINGSYLLPDGKGPFYISYYNQAGYPLASLELDRAVKWKLENGRLREAGSGAPMRWYTYGYKGGFPTDKNQWPYLGSTDNYNDVNVELVWW